MAKICLLLLALVAVATARPYGGAVVQNHHVSSSVVTPHLGLGYDMLGYPGMGGLGHTIASHSISHAVPHYGMGVMGLKGIGMYPGLGGLGYGYGGGLGGYLMG